MTVNHNITTDIYQRIHRVIVDSGYAAEVDWSETILPVSDPLMFWAEYGWVVMNSGMKNQIARMTWEKVRPQVLQAGALMTFSGTKVKRRPSRGHS